MIAWATIERKNKGLLSEDGDDAYQSLECYSKLPLDKEMKIIDSMKYLNKIKRLVYLAFDILQSLILLRSESEWTYVTSHLT